MGVRDSVPDSWRNRPGDSPIFDFSKPGSNEVRQQARNERDAQQLRGRFTPKPWRDSTGRLQGGGGICPDDPELMDGRKPTRRKPWVDPNDERGMAEDRRLAEEEGEGSVFIDPARNVAQGAGVVFGEPDAGQIEKMRKSLEPRFKEIDAEVRRDFGTAEQRLSGGE